MDINVGHKGAVVGRMGSGCGSSSETCGIPDPTSSSHWI